jgi:hypothetical protein
MDHEVHKRKKRKRFEATWRDRESLAAHMNPHVPHSSPLVSHHPPFKKFLSKKHNGVLLALSFFMMGLFQIFKFE